MSDGLAAYCIDLHRKNTDALGFIPSATIERYVAERRILHATENGELCGFLIHGTLSKPVVKIYQACVQYDARRWHHGLNLVKQLKDICPDAQEVKLRCGDDLPANEFWLAAGFQLIGSHTGGKRRGRRINEYRLHLGGGLFPQGDATRTGSAIHQVVSKYEETP